MALIPTTQVNVSPDDYKRKIAYALMQQGMDTSPVQAWTQGAARALQGALGGYEMYQDDQKQKSDEADATKAYLGFLQPQGSPPSAPQAAPAPMPPAPSPVASALAQPTQLASADPGPVAGPRPGGPVMPSPKVWGDQEAEAAGLYEPKPGKVAQALAPQSLPAAATGDDQDTTKARIAALLQSSSKAERQLGKSLAENYLASNLTPKYDFKTAGDTMYRTNASRGTAEPIRDVGKSTRPMSDDERKQWKVPEGVAAGIDDNGKPVFSQPSTVNTVSPVISGINDRFDAAAKSATAAPQVISSIHEARRAMDGGAITGAGADARLMLSKVGTMFGLPNEAVANTETARASLGAQVLESAKTLGSNPSNADRDYIEKVKGGSIALDEASIRRLLDMQEKWARDGVKRANDMGERMIQTDPEKLGRFKSMLTFADPPAYEDYIKANPAKIAPSAPSNIDPSAMAEAKRRGLIK